MKQMAPGRKITVAENARHGTAEEVVIFKYKEYTQIADTTYKKNLFLA